jgi:hypothetical protein
VQRAKQEPKNPLKSLANAPPLERFMNVKIKSIDWLYGIQASDAVHLLGQLHAHHNKLCEIFAQLSADQTLQKQTDSELRILIDQISKDFGLLKEAIEIAPRFKQVAPSGLCESLN